MATPINEREREKKSAEGRVSANVCWESGIGKRQSRRNQLPESLSGVPGQQLIRVDRVIRCVVRMLAVRAQEREREKEREIERKFALG